ncbi:threonine aldolase [Alkalicaulis satelles]|uniref:Threonine aldolase n=1 Tax=Alkalicaulis satelles TaxID=2609175 RepID=A0A5M6ZGL0_9PROT|nr:beta-eliminating lyase-related protein [Alkalicaulis satelles]KAA5803896.1 threonine aldolase [Alkalicaulis satelles]
MNFLSDTTAPAHPVLIEAIARANEGFAPSYGADPLSAQVTQRLRDIFETDLAVVLTVSGTAANALALSVLCPCDAQVLCHDEAHIHRDERGAPEFFTGGAKLLPLQGEHGKIDLQALDSALAQWPADFVHAPPPAVLSLSQLNEAGCAYSLDELHVLTSRARERGLFVHMDGARFASALVSLGCTPAEMSWKAGVDALCLGATKTGALGAEAVILFPSVMDRLPALQARLKRSGHMAPKARFMAAQMDAWLKGDLWLTLARQANAAAARLAERLARADGAELAHPADGNEVFVRLTPALSQRLRDAGAQFYAWPDGSARFVTSWCTTSEEIDAVLKAARG